MDPLILEPVSPEVLEAALPATWSPDDAERLSYFDFLERFRDADCCYFELSWPLKPGTERAALRAGFNNCLSFKPGARFVGSFIFDVADSLTFSPGFHTVFVFVKD